MSKLITLWLCLLGFVLSASADRRSEVIDYMRKENILARCERENKDENQCIKELKRLCGIQKISSSELTDELMACVRREKCGLPTEPKVNEFFVESKPKFSKKSLTYMVLNNGRNNVLPSQETKTMVRYAFSVWACYAPLTFTEVNSEKDADIWVSFTPRQHGFINYMTKARHESDSAAFDGPGGVLAHAFLPYAHTTTIGNFHYDDEETWIEDHTSGIKLFHTTVHELGHILGINHLGGTKDMMKAYYDDSFHESELDLGQGDIQEIQYRYGAKTCTDKAWQKYYDNKYPDIYRTCKDKASNCESMTYRQCLSDKSWMQENCARFCGFCGECKDLSDRCSEYDTRQCQGKNSGWFTKNCKGFCNQCAASPNANDYQDQTPNDDSATREEKREEAEKPKGCVDAYPECALYTKAMCQSKPHYPWMYENCRKYCGWCNELEQVFFGSNDNQIAVCKASKLDGIFKVADGSVYIIVKGVLYKRDAYRKTIDKKFRLDLQDLDVEGLRRPTAATYSLSSRTLYLIEGSKLFALKNFGDSDQTAQVMSLPPFFIGSQAAFIQNQGEKDDISLYVSQHIGTIRVENNSARIIHIQDFQSIFNAGKYKHRIPKSVDSAFQDGNKVYFFTGSSVTVAHRGADGRYTLPSFGATPFATSFLQCPQV